MLELSALHTVVIRLQKLNWTTQPITAQSYKNKLTLSSLEIWGGNLTSCFKLTQRLVFQLDYKRLSDRFLHFRDLRRKHKQYVGVIRSYPVGFFSISEVLINEKEQQDTKQCRGFFEALRNGHDYLLESRWTDALLIHTNVLSILLFPPLSPQQATWKTPLSTPRHSAINTPLLECDWVCVRTELYLRADTHVHMKGTMGTGNMGTLGCLQTSAFETSFKRFFLPHLVHLRSEIHLWEKYLMVLNMFSQTVAHFQSILA